VKTKYDDKLQVGKDLKGGYTDLSKSIIPTFAWKGRGKVDRTSVRGFYWVPPEQK
jgi:hypothetical protein